MNLGEVAESQRLPDSADCTVVVEPNIGSTARTKGSLFLLVTGEGGKELRDATKLVADRVREDYYYDLSAGISVCLRKAVRNANNILFHSQHRPDVVEGAPPPIGLAMAVVRGNELYVATLGPAEAYLIRAARLLTLPDADPDSGLPCDELEGPDVWHGEISVGDCLILTSPNVTRRIGLGPIQDTVGQLHPQAAVDQLHRQFGSGALGSTGGDGIIVVEATEVPATLRAQPLKPVWPNDSRAGAPDHSPIPLADQVVGGVNAVQNQAHHASLQADNWLRRGAYGLFDHMPQRPMSRGRVTPMSVRRERQQRAAVAVLGILAVIALVGTSMWFLGGTSRGDNVNTQQKAEDAYAAAQADIDKVFGSGRDLTKSDAATAAALLKDAFTQLASAETNGYSAAELEPLRNTVVTGLNSWFKVTMLQPSVVATFSGDTLERMVLGSDGAAYVIDSTNSTVYWVNLQTGTKLPILYAGQELTAGTVGNPRYLATAGTDVLVLDDFNSVWRWRPAASTNQGRGAWIKISIPDNANWGLGARAIGTFIVNSQRGDYNFYIVLPNANQILKYQPASDGSGFPKEGKANYLTVNQDVATVEDLYVDGKVYIVDKGKITQWVLGQKVTGWIPDPPGSSDVEKKGDILLRPSGPYYTRLVADNPSQDQGTFYAYDGINRRIVAFTKNTGTFTQQYMVARSSPWLAAVKGMFVVPSPTGGTGTVYWIESGSLLMAPLSGLPAASPSGEPSSASPSAGGY
jgi:hypothetical protein